MQKILQSVEKYRMIESGLQKTFYEKEEVCDVSERW